MSWFETLKKKQNHIDSITPVSTTELSINVKINILEFDLSKVIDNNELLEKIYAYKEKYPVSMQAYDERTNLRTWHSNWRTHLISTEFDPLIKQITLCLKNNLFGGFEYSIADFWLNIYDNQGYAKRHNHALCAYSIVYFVNSSDASENLIFDNNVIGDKRKEIIVKPTPGKLVVFPGSVYHRVDTNSKDTGSRISIAANFNAVSDDTDDITKQRISLSKFGKIVDN